MIGFSTVGTPGFPAGRMIVFQIFTGDFIMKVALGAQMNTNFDMLPVSLRLVHMLAAAAHDINAQKYGKLPPG